MSIRGRYVYMPAGRQFWAAVSLELRRIHGYEPSLWLGDDRHLPFARHSFPSARILRLNGWLDIRGNQTSQLESSHDLAGFPYAEMLEIQAQTMQMMNRVYPPTRGNYLDREYRFWSTATHLWDELIRSEATALIASEAPHSYPQFILYQLCRFIGLPTLHFAASNIAPFLIPRLGLEHNGCLTRGDSILACEDALHARIDRYFAQLESREYSTFQPDYMKPTKIRPQQADPSIGQPRVRFHHTEGHAFPRLLSGRLARVLRYFIRYATSTARTMARNLYRIVLIRRLKTPYSAVSTLTPPPSKTYVYFAMHYEPERTTNPEGVSFWSQYSAITALRAALPASTELVVREHPSQFMIRNPGYRGRAPEFYQWLADLDGVHVVPTDLDPVDLIVNSQMVATITGTVGLEAVALGKQAIVLGNPWYSGLPGAISLDDVANGIGKDCAPSLVEVAGHVHRLASECGILGVVNPSNEKAYRSCPDFRSLFDDSAQSRIAVDVIASILSGAGIDL